MRLDFLLIQGMVIFGQSNLNFGHLIHLRFLNILNVVLMILGNIPLRNTWCPRLRLAVKPFKLRSWLAVSAGSALVVELLKRKLLLLGRLTQQVSIVGPRLLHTGLLVPDAAAVI